MTQPQSTSAILKDETAQKIMASLGLADSAPETQAKFLEETGEVIMKRIALEVLKVLPETAHPRFDELMQNGDVDAWKKFLGAHLGDTDDFIETVVKKEVAALRAEMAA